MDAMRTEPFEMVVMKSLIANAKHLNSPSTAFTRWGAEEKVQTNNNEI
jgi:hypothetical protein